MYCLESVLFLCTVHIPDVLSGKFCFCAQYTFLMYLLESVPFLCTVYISDVLSGKCFVSVHSTRFLCTVWKGFCFCSQYTFLMYCLESVLFLWKVHISDYRVESVVSVHITYFWCTTWSVFCFCALYTFLMPSNVIFLYVIYSLVQMEKFLCCWYCFVVISPWRRQFQSLSKHVTAVRFLMNLPDTKYSSYTHITVRYDVS